MSETSDRMSNEEIILMHTLIEHMPDRIYAMDPEGRYLFDNRAHRTFLGVNSIDDVIGKTVYDFFPKEQADDYRADDRAVLSSGNPLKNREEPITAPDGKTMWVSTTKVPEYGADGAIRGLVAISRDITSRKLAHDHVQEVNRQLEADLAMAAETQAALFPSEYPDITGSRATLRFTDYHQFSHSLGGDFFTVVRLPDNRVGVFICDVMGHGVRSALVAAMIHAQFHELAREDPPPDALLAALNTRLTRLMDSGREMVFATALYLIIDLETLQLQHAHAGHPNPLHICRISGQVQDLIEAREQHGPGLGLVENPTFSAHPATLKPNQTILLFTDGVTEATDPVNKMYGSSRLQSVARDAINVRGEVLMKRILDDVAEFTRGHPADDDRSILVIDICGNDG